MAIRIVCGSCQQSFELHKGNSKRYIYEVGKSFNWLSTVCSSCLTVHHLFINAHQSGELDKNGVKSNFLKYPGSTVKSTFTSAIGPDSVVIDGVVIGFLDQLFKELMQQAS